MARIEYFIEDKKNCVTQKRVAIAYLPDGSALALRAIQNKKENDFVWDAVHEMAFSFDPACEEGWSRLSVDSSDFQHYLNDKFLTVYEAFLQMASNACALSA